MSETAHYGRLLGLGLGPGDPELITLKALRLLKATRHVATFAKAGRQGHAERIITPHLEASHNIVRLEYPVTTEIDVNAKAYKIALRDFYEQSCAQLAALMRAGQDVALVCEGDPLFYGSFMHLFTRLRAEFVCEIVPGIAGMSGAWSAAQMPMTWGDDIMTIIPGTLNADAIVARLQQADAAVLMKIGRNFAKVRQAIIDAGRFDDAIYVERGTMAGEIIQPLAQYSGETPPYFSLILIPGNGRRP
ncbi:MAG: precorrin-2 C(20)-methyltransferase [Hyphomicrobiales bacterium]|nr:precorrin-2 C(20)-methyltransferase [Hyphomicrobiales bacterium]